MPSPATDDDAKARLADYLATRPRGTGLKAILGWMILGLLAVLLVLLLAVRLFDAIDLRINYVAARGTVLAVTTTCVLEDTGRNSTMRIGMPCARAFARQDHPGFLRVLRVRPTSDVSYAYVAGGRRYTTRAVERLDVPRPGSTIEVYVRKSDPAVSRYGGLAN